MNYAFGALELGQIFGRLCSEIIRNFIRNSHQRKSFFGENKVYLDGRLSSGNLLRLITSVCDSNILINIRICLCKPGLCGETGGKETTGET